MICRYHTVLRGMWASGVDPMTRYTHAVARYKRHALWIFFLPAFRNLTFDRPP